jgi:predicted TIM-barrel fold metal-dependent hydrolase
VDADRTVDCHAHIIDPQRFPFPPGRGYKPRADESGTREQFCDTLDRHGIRHGVLIQVSGYGTNNGAILDAVRAYPGRFKAIVQIDPKASDRDLEALAGAGAVGVRFNLVNYVPDALAAPDARALLARLRALGWFAQIYADDVQWPQAAAVLRQSGIRVLIDHFGVRAIESGVDRPGFRSVLALGREGNAVVKLSSLFRVSKKLLGFEDLDPFVEALIDAFGVERCIWGSDWPFINVPRRPVYANLMTPLARWFPDANDRARVLALNPQRLFGFTA